MERFGTAWEKIQVDLQEGYPEPDFDDSSPVFKATLWPHPEFAASVATATASPPSKRSRKSPEERRKEIAALLERKEHSATEISSALGIGERQVRRLLDVMVDAGEVVPNTDDPTDPRRKYRLGQ